MLCSAQYNLRIERRLVGVIDSRKALDLTGTSLCIEAFRITPFCNGKRGIDMYFNERNACCLMACTHAIAVRAVWADHANNRHNARTRNEERSLARPANGFLATSSIEANAGIQTMPKVVAIEAERETPRLQEAVLQFNGDGALARSTQTSEPGGDAMLTSAARAQCGVGGGGVPADIRVGGRIDGFLHGMHAVMVRQRAILQRCTRVTMATLSHSSVHRIHPS